MGLQAPWVLPTPLILRPAVVNNQSVGPRSKTPSHGVASLGSPAQSYRLCRNTEPLPTS